MEIKTVSPFSNPDAFNAIRNNLKNTYIDFDKALNPQAYQNQKTQALVH